jgi:cysteine-S-conjugate beta-lyase
VHPYDSLDPAALRDRYSIKWNLYPEGVLPLWVADMDFPIADAVRNAMLERLKSNLGYPMMGGDAQLVAAIIERQAEFGLTGLEPKHFNFVSSVVPGLYAAVQGLTSPGDEIITMTPIYPPFLTSITDHGRVALQNPMVFGETNWSIDYEQLERLPTPKTKVFMLCNPQNPTGRVFTERELMWLAGFVKMHDLLVITDELHAELILDGTHIPFASLPDMRDRTVTLTGPCKAYNTAGLGGGVMLAHNTELLERIKNATKGLMGHPNSLSMTMWQAGLEESGAWLRDTLEYIRGNRDHLTAWLRDHLPEVRYHPLEGTYLAWMDFNAFPFASSLHKILVDEAKVGLNDGPPYGAGYSGWLRINLATSRSILEEALNRIERCIRSKVD